MDNEERDMIVDEQDLWDADPDCNHEVVDAPGGGIVCTKCGGWFCW